MTSENRTDEAYVWIWLPDATQPVVAGRLARARDGRLTFNYGQSYLARADAIAIYDPELPLRAGAIETHNKMLLPSSILLRRLARRMGAARHHQQRDRPKRR